ncbi:MAG: TetR/AcrR family transcriptional regulator [Rhodospirillales bacterium]|nr:TetR/AcrR family transcriptional regulator [Rhodospirillales bacterium]
MSAAALTRKDRLLAAAANLFHRQGVAQTTLADVAAAAKVALGSVFYYFRAKDDLVAAVVNRRSDDVVRLISRQRDIPAPRARLEALIQIWVDDREIDVRYGCPIGSLCFELAKARGPLSKQAAKPFRSLLVWCEEQFRLLGAGTKSGRHALHLVASLQGISLTAAVLGDSKLIVEEAEHLKEWLRTM